MLTSKNDAILSSSDEEEGGTPGLAPVVTQESSETTDADEDALDDQQEPTSTDAVTTNWANLTIETFVTVAQNCQSNEAIDYHMAFSSAKHHKRISATCHKLDTYDLTSINSVIARHGLLWTGTDEWQHIQREFHLLREGRTAWLQRATEALLRGDRAPHAYLARSTQANKFQVIYARGQVLTPHDCGKESRAEGAWICCTTDGSRKHEPTIAQFEVGRKHEKMFLDKVKLISCDEALRDPRSKEGTMAVSTLHDTANGVPILCPLPWTWAATIQLHPDWSCRQTTRWLAQRMLAWPRSEEGDTDMETVQSTVWKFLCAAASACSAKKPNCKNLIALSTPSMDAGLDLFLRNHAERYWWRDLEDEEDEEDEPLLPPEAPEETTQAPTVEQPTHSDQASTTSDEQPPSRSSHRVQPPRSDMSTGHPTGSPPQPATVSTEPRSTSKTALPPKPQGVKRPTGAAPNPTKRARVSFSFAQTQPSTRSPSPATTNPPSQQTTPTGAPPATTPVGTPPAMLSDIEALMQNPSALVQALGAMASITMSAQQRDSAQQTALLTHLQAGTDARNLTTTKENRWNEFKQARFAAFAGVPVDSASMPTFWKTVVKARSEDRDGITQGLLNQLKRQHPEEFAGWNPHPQFFDDVKNLNFSPTQLNEKTWHRGLTPMAFADRSIAKIDAANSEKETFDKYGNFIQLSRTGASSLDSKPPQAPRTTEKLCLYLRRWLLFLKAVWGSACPLYMQSKALYNELLVLLDRVLRSSDFMKRRGASIMWELCYETRRFFQQLFTSDDFAAATERNSPSPTATCTINVHRILTLDGGPAGDLPEALRPPTPREPNRHLAQGNGGGGNGDTGSNHRNSNGNNRDRNNNSTKTKEYRPNKVWTPAFATLFGVYSAKDRERLKLGAICRECRKSVEWITKRLNLARGVCATGVVLGQCPPTCRFSTHDVTVDDAAAAEVALVLAPAVQALAQTAGLQRS